MDLNAALLTLIGEQKQLAFNKDKHIESLVSLNNELAEELQRTKSYVSQLEEGNRVMAANLMAINCNGEDKKECQQTSPSQ